MTARMPSGDALTFVTVVFDVEVRLLELQARSLAMFVAPEAVGAIIVLDNSVRGLSRRQHRRLADAYGPLWSLVAIRRTRELIDAGAASGWRSQQAAKLTVASLVETSHYVALDAKNHFTRAVDRASFVGADGRAHGAVHGYHAHPLRDALERTVVYLGGDTDAVARALDAFPPTATPFVFDTAYVRAMIADVTERSGRRFDEEFERAGLLEFFLYSSWLELRGPGIASAIDGQSIPSPTVWPRLASLAGVEQVIAEAADDDAFVFAVHRQALARADADTQARIARHWADAGLFDDADAARRFIRSFRLAYRPTLLRTRLAERARRWIRRRT